jgi:hypothetical protein
VVGSEFAIKVDRDGRGPLAIMLVAVLTFASVVVVLPTPAAAAAATTLYLTSDGVPKASLSRVLPVSPVLSDYDPSRDGQPGLALKRTSKGWAENDQKKYQSWVGSVGGLDIDAEVSLTFWSALRGFANGGRGRVEAYLLECSPGGANCSLIDQAVADTQPWSQSSEFAMRTVDFGNVVHSFATNRALVLKIVVGGAADDDMVFAYDTVGYPAGLTFTGVTSPTTTSLPVTTTIPITTTSLPGIVPLPNITVPTSTSTTIDNSPTATPPRSNTTTTTSPTTTTTRSNSSGTTFALVASPGGPGGGGSSDGSGGPGSSPDSGATEIGEDPAVAAIGDRVDRVDPSIEGGSLAGSALDGLELVIPPWAASMVASPLVVIGFVFEAMTDSGRAILLPVVLLLVGMLWVLVENRGLAVVWWRQRDRRARRTG